MAMRAATLADLEAITELALAALPDDPFWLYRYPRAKDYPDDHYKYSRIRFEEYLHNVEAGTYAAMVVEAASEEGQHTTKLIAMSMWALPGLLSPGAQQIPGMKPPTDHVERRDANPARMLEFRKVFNAAKSRYFDKVYGNRQLNLLMLATHPEYRRQGAATMLMKWGMERAERNDVALSLFASPMGSLVYTKLGFKKLAVVHVQVADEEEFKELPAMVWTPTIGGQLEEKLRGDIQGACFFRVDWR
ncbi:hypothetical protein BX600DRAFT_522179 [Xylariales sp. PMI_506]|nr:hypothetical protein BX600DRAFT_522179 [Xylariales sp. PMI_506]